MAGWPAGVVTQGGGDAGFRGQPQDGDGQVAWDEANRHDRLAGLSARERMVLELIGEGLTNRQIGERLFVSEKMVKNYVSMLFAKLGMKQRTQAVAYAARALGGCKLELSQNMRIIDRKPP